MPPPLSIKYLYAAFAENSSCGAAYYGKDMTCGTTTATDDGPFFRYEDIVKKRTFDGSLEVGILPDREVFGPTPTSSSSYTPPRKQEGTPDTSPSTSPDSSLDLKGCEYADKYTNESSGQQHGPRLLTPPNLDTLEGIAVHYYAGPAMKKNSFVSTTSNSSHSSKSRCTTPDSVERARGVTFRDEKRVPKSVNAANASLSKSSSTLSRDEKNGSPANASFPSKKSGDNDYGVFSTNQEDQVGMALVTKNESKNSEVSKRDYVSFTPSPSAKFDFQYGTHDIIQDTKLEQQGNTLATSNMFTKEDLDAITPLQIATYLTNEERKKIGTKVLSSKLSKGYNLAGGKDVCHSCNMPLLRKSGQLVDGCVICPVLKKRVLKKILATAATSTAVSVDSSLTPHTFATMPSTDVSLGSDMSASKGDEHHDFIVVPSSEHITTRKNVTFASATGENYGANNGDKYQDNSSLKKDNFIVAAKKTLVDAFKTKSYYASLKPLCDFNNCHQLEFAEGGEPMKHARGTTLTKKVVSVSEELKEKGIKKCHELDFEEGKNAVAYAGEMMVKKVALVPEAMKYKESNIINCQGYEFNYGKDAMAHAAEVLTKNVACSPKGSKYEDNNETNDIAENEKNDELVETVENAINQGVLFDHHYEEKIIVENASADAEEEDVLLNSPAWKSEPNQLRNQEIHQGKKNEDDVTAEKVEDAKEENLLNGPAATQSHLEQVKREDAIESSSSPTQDKTKDDVTAEEVEDVKEENLLNGPAAIQSHLEEVKGEDVIASPSYPTQDGTKDDVTAEEVEDVKEEHLLNGPVATESHLEEVKGEDVIASPSSPTQDQPPLATISTSRGNDMPMLMEEHPPLPPNHDQRLDPATFPERSPSSSESVISALGSTDKSITSEAQSAVSNTLVSLMDRIKQTKEKMLKTEDLNEQIKCAELLAKLCAVAVALKELEEVADFFYVS